MHTLATLDDCFHWRLDLLLGGPRLASFEGFPFSTGSPSRSA